MSTIEKEDLTQLNMKVAGMTCEGCEKTIETGLELLDGIASAKASHIDSTVSIQIDDTKVDSANIADKIVELGYVIVN